MLVSFKLKKLREYKTKKNLVWALTHVTNTGGKKINYVVDYNNFTWHVFLYSLFSSLSQQVNTV